MFIFKRVGGFIKNKTHKSGKKLQKMAKTWYLDLITYTGQQKNLGI